MRDSWTDNNPVRAGVVTDAADSTWTSHRAYLGLTSTPVWLDVATGLMLSGFEPTRARREAFGLPRTCYAGIRSGSPRRGRWPGVWPERFAASMLRK